MAARLPSLDDLGGFTEISGAFFFAFFGYLLVFLLVFGGFSCLRTFIIGVSFLDLYC